MNKRIIPVLMAFVIMVCMLVSAVPVYAIPTEDSITVSIVPDKTEAHPGDTITYTVNMGPVKGLRSAGFTLVIPSGLTYVMGKEVDGLKTSLGADTAEYTDSTKTMIIGGGGSYNSDGTTAIMRFSCTVDNEAVGKTLKITFEGDEDFSDDEYETYDTTFDFDASKVAITAAPVGVTGVTVTPETKELTAAGATFTVSAEVAPATATNKKVTFSSSNTAVAVVDADTGIVTAVANGEAVITATTEDGKITDNCTVTVNIPHIHIWTEISAKASTCTEKGNNHYWYCTACGKYYKADKITETTIVNETLPLAGHSYGSLIAEVPSTHTATGMKSHYQCSVCHKLFDADKHETTLAALTIDRIPHNYGTDWKKDGTGHWHECSCGNIIDTAAHTYGDWRETVSATETSKGEKQRTCTVCGYVKTEEIPVVTHTHVWTEISAKASTCTEKGNNHYWYCTACGKYYKADKITETTVVNETLPLAGHSYGALIAEVPSTHTATGMKSHYQCSVCHMLFDADKHETTLSALTIDTIPHSYGTDWKKDGTGHWHECSCGDKAGFAAHIPGAAATEKTPQICAVCGYIIAPALGHTHSYGTEWIHDATNHWHKCTGCNEVRDKAAHTYGNWIVTKEATVTETGSKEYICSACGYKEIVEIPKVGLFTCTLTFNTNGGSAIPTVSNVNGTTVDLTSYKSTKTDYDFDGWYSDSSLMTKVTSIKLTSNITVYAKWTAKIVTPEMSFVDVPNDAYYKDAVIWAVENGITTGTGPTTFSPDGICTRAQAVTFLWRASGSSAPKLTTMPFNDVPAGSYYYNAVLWAVEQGVVNGTSATMFSPDINCSRAQIVTMLWRMEGSKAATVFNPFTDVANSAYYAEAVLWAVGKGVTAGTSATAFSPDDNCTRAQIVTFIYRDMK